MATPVILLIEPNKIFVQAYIQALEKSGYEIKHVTGAQAAIASADEQKPDLVILEIELAKHNGIEFLHEFRSYHEWQNVPVIINSNVPPGKFAKSGQELELLGVSRYFYKPKTSLADLTAAVAGELTNEPASN